MQLQCPLQKFDFDVITLGHGSGGLLTHKLLQSGVFDVLQNDMLNQQHDGAQFELHGKLAFSTDSFVVSPIFFKGGNIGELAVNGTVNDLAMCGAIPKYLSLSFILEEGLKTSELAVIIQSIKIAADKAEVKIVTGDTKVVEQGKGDKIFINTSGIGVLHENAAIHHNRISAGDAVIISGSIANHGVAIMSEREGLEFETNIESDTRPLNHIIKKLLDKFGSSIKFLRDPTRGGVASVLNEVAEITGLGVEIEQQKLPIAAQVEGACEMLGLDPLYVANEGVFIAIVENETAEKIISMIQSEEHGKEAAIIGYINNDTRGKVLLKSNIGGRRVINYLTGEQLPRIC
jgi:hydrogenase expression/formation protein HypE